MKLGAVIAAAVVAVGVGQAEAATISNGNYAVTIELLRTEWWSITGDGTAPDPAPYLGLNVGDTVTGNISFSVEDKNLNFVLAWPGAITSRLDNSFYQTSENAYFANRYDETIWFELSDGLFQGLFIDATNSGGWWQYAEVAFHEIAPVPLPATAALLPLGIGALAMIRRRRRT